MPVTRTNTIEGYDPRMIRGGAQVGGAGSTPYVSPTDRLVARSRLMGVERTVTPSGSVAPVRTTTPTVGVRIPPVRRANPITGTAPPPSVVGGGGGGGAAGGGGGGGSATTPPGLPQWLQDLKEEQIAAAIAAIEARFGAERAGLEAEREAGDVNVDAQQAVIGMEEEAAVEESFEDFASRRLARSGFAERAQDELRAVYAAQKAAVSTEWAVRKAEIQARLEQGIINEQEAEIASTLADIEASYAMLQLNGSA